MTDIQGMPLAKRRLSYGLKFLKLSRSIALPWPPKPARGTFPCSPPPVSSKLNCRLRPPVSGPSLRAREKCSLAPAHARPIASDLARPRVNCRMLISAHARGFRAGIAHGEMRAGKLETIWPPRAVSLTFPMAKHVCAASDASSFSHPATPSAPSAILGGRLGVRAQYIRSRGVKRTQKTP